MSSRNPSRAAEGVYRRHSRACATKNDPAAACTCEPRYRAVITLPDGKQVARHFDTLREAKYWRADNGGRHAAKLRPASRLTVADAADHLLAGMRDGTIPNRSGQTYKPSAIRSYAAVLRLRVLPRLGRHRLDRLTRADVQAFVNRLHAEGLTRSTIANTLDPLRTIYREQIHLGAVSEDPVAGVRIPRTPEREHVRRTLDPAATAAMLAALPDDDAEGTRGIFTVAYLLGVRRGEIRALRWSDVDLDAGTIHVSRTWDDHAGEVPTKTQAGTRLVPILPDVRRTLIARKLATGRDGDDLVFGTTADVPFVPSTIRSRSIVAWKAAGILPVEVGEDGEPRPRPWGLHEGRHTAATALRAAGIDAETRMAIIGHSTADSHARYQHVRADHLADAAAKLAAHYARAAG